MALPQPTVVRGTIYPSQRAAAIGTGVSFMTIWNALENGTIDQVGIRKRGRKGQPCYMNGHRWPSRTDAARALGVTRVAISRAIAEGRTYVRPGGVGRFV